MKKIWIILLFAMLSSVTKAQINLVPNPSFEDTVACPFYYNQMNRSIGWNTYRLTPDYFNSCNNTYVGIPQNDVGFQYPKTGEAYAGFIPFQYFAMSYREYLGIQLLQPLIMGRSYYAEFYASRALNPNASGFNINIATNKLGLRFSTVAYSYINPVPVDNLAHVYSDSLIFDTLNWVKISGFFIADSAYQYLSIGNFFNDASTTYVRFDSSAAEAYYYVDDVLVMDSTITSINEHYTTSPIEIFPNLFHDELIIEGNNVKSILIFDALGRKCIERISSASLKKINTSNLVNGVYFIRVYTADKSFIRKIIKGS